MNPLATKNHKHPKNLLQIQILLRHKTISRTHLYILHHLHFGLVFVPLANTSVKVEAHKVLGFQQNQMLQSFVVECLKEFSQTNGCMIGLGGSKSLTLTCSMGFCLRTDVGPCALPIHPTTNWWRMRGHKSFIVFDRKPSPLVLKRIVKSLTTDSLTNQVFLVSSTDRSNGGSLQLSCFRIRSM